jgi:hypothetical protein
MGKLVFVDALQSISKQQIPVEWVKKTFFEFIKKIKKAAREDCLKHHGKWSLLIIQ